MDLYIYIYRLELNCAYPCTFLVGMGWAGLGPKWSQAGPKDAQRDQIGARTAPRVSPN